MKRIAAEDGMVFAALRSGLAIAAAALLVACASGEKQAGDAHPAMAAASTKKPATQSAEQPFGPLTSVALSRMTCEKPECQVYSVIFSSVGTAEYIGGSEAPRHGDFVARGDFTHLLKRVEGLHPEAFEWRYGPVTGPRTRVIVVIQQGTRRKIAEAVSEGDAPSSFASIVRAIDAQASAVGWRPAR